MFPSHQDSEIRWMEIASVPNPFTEVRVIETALTVELLGCAGRLNRTKPFRAPPFTPIFRLPPALKVGAAELMLVSAAIEPASVMTACCCPSTSLGSSAGAVGASGAHAATASEPHTSHNISARA